ncbi:MAG: PmeII family type II restriction endonuclease [Candidatus Symbiobacter sp.]|nr:PmeII family type II restriction endonuclease [Candidatus Symbiobacter sp.]
MNGFNLKEVNDYIAANVDGQFHERKIAKLKDLKFEHIIRRKNPYLFRAKGSNNASDLVKSVLDATVSSGEETTFGNFLENIAIYVCHLALGGRKSGIVGIDLEFEQGDHKFLISIKSGPNWGNSSQVKNLVAHFNAAKKTLSSSGGFVGKTVTCIEGCCYGIENTPNKGSHLKLCGQRFWELISGGSQTLYCDIIEPLGYNAKQRSDQLDMIYTEKLNMFTAAFVDQFCDHGIINWHRLLKYNSGSSE